MKVSKYRFRSLSSGPQGIIFLCCFLRVRTLVSSQFQTAVAAEVALSVKMQMGSSAKGRAAQRESLQRGSPLPRPLLLKA